MSEPLTDADLDEMESAAGLAYPLAPDMRRLVAEVRRLRALWGAATFALEGTDAGACLQFLEDLYECRPKS